MYLPLHLSGMNAFKPGKMMEETNCLDLVDLRFVFKIRFG